MKNLQLYSALASVLGVVSAVLPQEGYAKPKKQNTDKPNVIILFSDQHRADVFSYAGNPDVQTPAFDKMANSGVVYNRAYSQDAVSAPSRNSLFTGLYPRTVGLLNNGDAGTSVWENATSLQTVFQFNGYKTYGFGKRHLHHGADKGWTVLKSHARDENPSDNYVKWVEEQGYAEEFGEDWATEFGRFPKGNSLENSKYPTAKMGTRTTKLPEDYTMEAYSAKNAIEVIKEHKKSGEPFFCYTSFYRPHQPYNPLQKYLDKHDATKWGTGRNNGGSVAMPASLHEDASNLPPMLAAQRGSERGIWCLGLASQDEQLYRDYIVAYYALVEEIDYWVGEIFDELEKTGLDENTIVIYASDHGDFVGRHGMIEKAAAGHNVYEETLRVPLMFYWKDKLDGGQRSEDLAGLIDLYPTLVDLIGLELPEMNIAPQGISLKENLVKSTPLDREYMVSENWFQASVITKDYKLGIWLDSNPIYPTRDYRAWGDMLFNYENDPYEMDNIYRQPSMVPKINELRSYYKEFTEAIPDTGKQESIKNFKEKMKNK